MSDMRGRHGRNFSGCYLQVAGDDEKLNAYLDKLNYVSRCIVLGRADTTEGQGVLFVQCAAGIVANLHKMAIECGLAVTA